MHAEQHRHLGQQAVLARAQGLLHQRIDFGEPAISGEVRVEHVAQTAAQTAGGTGMERCRVR